MTTMQKSGSPDIPDKEDRERAIRERTSNVVMDAGAGTGKTTILVARVIEMIAPADDGPAHPLSRIAALTFTRKAAGELRLRLREGLLSRLAEDGLTTLRRERLQAALDEIDLAFVGTIHSFADRLLRLRPVEAELSPIYEIAEDTDELVKETTALLVEGAQARLLAKELAGTEAERYGAEAEQTIVTALLSGIRREDSEGEWVTRHGLFGLVQAVVNQRDVPVPFPDARPFDHASFRKAASELLEETRGVSPLSQGGRWLLGLRKLVERYIDERDPVLLRRALTARLNGKPASARLGVEFGGDKLAWAAWQAFHEGKKRESEIPLRKELLAPLDEWLAVRLARLVPVVLALYEKVKARHGVVDQIDLLLKLRDLLARDASAREHYQQLFEHVFIDEFQDTDPLQAEIVMFLCEDGAKAERFADIEPAPGRLTLVGDPKQSIYRFRRADIAMYERVRRMVASREHLSIRLAANFRSKPSLIEWFNARFEKVLGPVKEGEPLFNAESGEVAYQPLVAGREDDEGASVHLLPIEVTSSAKPKADDYRRVEAQALARYLRWLTEKSGVTILDPATFEHRPVAYGDIAILAASTANLHYLFPELDAMGVPHSVRGGKLFLGDPLHRQLLLGCSALANPSDGVAHAALLSPPFFALDFADLAAEKSAPREAESNDERVLRVREAKKIVAELRKRRFERSPGATMRDLIEKSGIARLAATGQNGAQRVDRLNELCFYFDTLAANEGLEFDAASERLRAIALDPVQLDPPHPIGGRALQILTMHQSKGLEFPVTVLWDGRASWTVQASGGAFQVDRDGRGWAIALDGLSWEESPTGQKLKAEDRSYAKSEKKRLIYVGATRARDLLVFAKAGKIGDGLIANDLLAAPQLPSVRELETYVEGKGASWAADIEPAVWADLTGTTKLDVELSAEWGKHLSAAKQPKLVPTSITSEAQKLENTQKRKERRYGPDFGKTVHRAIELLVLGRSASPKEAVQRAATEHRLNAKHIEAAISDTARAIEALKGEGLLDGRVTLRLEYPIARASADGQKLLIGYVDLVAAQDGVIDVIDFKTDKAPKGSVEEAYPAYVEQVRRYGEALTAGRRGLRLGRAGLLFTEDGRLLWC